MDDQLFASFMLDEEKGLEIALKAENVAEATPFNTAIQELPASIDYLEGIMPLRGDVIPVINLKKRLGLDTQEYGENATVAVVTIYNQQFGLLFDDIREVFKTEPKYIMPISSVLQSDDPIISAIIKRNQGERTAELLDLTYLFKGQSLEVLDQARQSTAAPEPSRQTSYSRWVVFTCVDQSYGVPVQYSREIAFFSEIDDMFKSDHVEGAIQLRDRTIPVMDGRYLLTDHKKDRSADAENRVLILAAEECSFGMMVDEIKTILTIADADILSVPSGGSENLLGIFPQDDGTNILLLDIPNLVCNQIEDIKSLTRIKNGKSKDSNEPPALSRSHHLITENCYLIFAIDKNFAIELKDVQEIIESENILKVPRADGYITSVINLRGTIVPVVNMRSFYNYPAGHSEDSKLIICRGQSRTIALEIDQIVTIYKQEDYHSTPSLNPQLAQKKDTLDRLIEYEKEDGLKEHVLVVNMHNLIRNHLEFKTEKAAGAEPAPHDIPTEHDSEPINS
ncbi:MAG: chemotaxis protein CheW [Desulfopila sp.]